MKLHAPCFTVGTRFWCWCAVPIFLQTCCLLLTKLHFWTNLSTEHFTGVVEHAGVFWQAWKFLKFIYLFIYYLFKRPQRFSLWCPSINTNLFHFFLIVDTWTKSSSRPEFSPFLDSLSHHGLMNTQVFRNAFVAHSNFVYPCNNTSKVLWKLAHTSIFRAQICQ